MGEPLATGELPFEQAGAFLLGRDMAAQCGSMTQQKLARIIDEVFSDREELARLVPTALDEESWDKRFAWITELFGKLTNGFLENRRTA